MNPIEKETIIKYDQLRDMTPSEAGMRALVFMENVPGEQDIRDLEGLVDLLEGADITIVCDEEQATRLKEIVRFKAYSLVIDPSWNGHAVPPALRDQLRKTIRPDVILSTLAYDACGAYVKKGLERSIAHCPELRHALFLLHDPAHQYLRIANRRLLLGRVYLRMPKRFIYKILVTMVFSMASIFSLNRSNRGWVRVK